MSFSAICDPDDEDCGYASVPIIECPGDGDDTNELCVPLAE